MPNSIAAVILSAGKGTRMKSARSKVLHEILGKPLVYYPVVRATQIGADPIVAVVGHQGAEVEQAIRASAPKAPVKIAIQEQQLGTAHAVLAAKKALEGFVGDVLILSGDVPLVQAATLTALIEAKQKAKASVALVTARPPSPKGLGRIVREGGVITHIVEEKDATPEQRALGEINAGLYLIDSRFLWTALARVDTRNAQGEFYLTDLIAMAAAEPSTGSACSGVVGVEASHEEMSGINDRLQLAEATRAMRQRINEHHMREGVTFDDPSGVAIDEGVEIAADARIGPNVVLTGRTRIGKNAVIGMGCVISDSVVGEGVLVKPYSVFEEAVVGDRSLIGPFARLRPGTELAEGVHIGNFVETKKARIGKGSKANHLTYLGDCEIGSAVNVGAGTITCNYDGVNKHQTVLEDGVFVGSDSQLVAPVRVGKGAYIAAGSTIVEDVPEMSLAIARGRQTIKPDWVKTKAPKKAT